MKTSPVKSFLLVILLLIPFIDSYSAPCNCTSPTLQGRERYIYHTDGPGCCSSPAINFGTVVYEVLNEGQWEEVNRESMDAAAAQAKCCP